MCINIYLFAICILEVKSEAAFYCFKIYICCLGNSSCCCKEVAAHFACEVKNFTTVVLCKIELVCLISSRSFYIFRNINICCSCVNSNFNCTSLGSIVKCYCIRKCKCCCFSRKNNCKLTCCCIISYVICFRTSPSKFNLIIRNTCERKCDNSIFAYIFRK